MAALLDFNFDYLVAPKIIKLLNVVGLLGVSFFAFVVVLTGLWVFQLRNGEVLGLFILLSSPVVWVVQALLVRIFLESVIVRFKEMEYLRSIKDKL